MGHTADPQRKAEWIWRKAHGPLSGSKAVVRLSNLSQITYVWLFRSHSARRLPSSRHLAPVKINFLRSQSERLEELHATKLQHRKEKKKKKKKKGRKNPTTGEP